MNVNQAELTQAGQTGSLKVSQAFSRFSGQPVKVMATEAKLIPIREILTSLQTSEEKAVIVSAQVISSGLPGAAIMVMARGQALRFVDLMTGKPRGTTGVMMENDRSAVKETLNILSNSYLGALSELSRQKLLTTIPHIMMAGNLQAILEQSFAGRDGQAILFKTVLFIAAQEVELTLFMVFSDKLAELLNQVIN